MNRPLLLGEIVEKDDAICLQTGANVWYPLDGASGIAEKFRETFNRIRKSHIGKRLYKLNGLLYLENGDQRQACVAKARQPGR